MSTETVGFLGTGAQNGHLNFHTAPDLCRESTSSRVYIPCIDTHARCELPEATQVFVAVLVLRISSVN